MKIKNKMSTYQNILDIFKPKENIILGKGYGKWKASTFRIANFPAISAIESFILEEPLCKKKAPKVIFEGFGAYSIDISVTYFVQTKDFAKFQATKQSINLGILKVLEKEKIVMARS